MKEGVKEFYAAEAQPFPRARGRRPTSRSSARSSRCRAWSIIGGRRRARSSRCSYFLNGTRTGRRMQATAQNPTVARVLGIPVERMILLHLPHQRRAGRARLLPGDARSISPNSPTARSLGLVAFIAAIVGGFNQVRGAIVGGLLLGVVDNFVAAYLVGAVPRRDPAVPADRRDPVASAGPARPRRGAHRMSAAALSGASRLLSSRC